MCKLRVRRSLFVCWAAAAVGILMLMLFADVVAVVSVVVVSTAGPFSLL